MHVAEELKFSITVRHGFQDYTYKVERTVWALGVERFVLHYKSGKIELENNRPILVRKGLKHRKPTWKETTGIIPNPAFLELVTHAIDAWLEKNGK